MSRTYEGLIEIPFKEFWAFVKGYLLEGGDVIAYGVPRINKQNQCIEIDFAASDEGDPSEWATIPMAVKQWKEFETTNNKFKEALRNLVSQITLADPADENGARMLNNEAFLVAKELVQ